MEDLKPLEEVALKLEDAADAVTESVADFTVSYDETVAKIAIMLERVEAMEKKVNNNALFKKRRWYHKYGN